MRPLGRAKYGGEVKVKKLSLLIGPAGQLSWQMSRIPHFLDSWLTGK
jgi:hypothetical protein